MLGWRRKNIF